MLKKVKRIKLGKQIYRRLMKRVLERDECRCQKCGSIENLQVHHMIKRSQLGNDSLDNLVTLCAYCHMGENGQVLYSVPAIRDPLCLLPDGGAWTTSLFSASGQSLQQAKTPQELKIPPAMKSGFGQLRIGVLGRKQGEGAWAAA